MGTSRSVVGDVGRHADVEEAVPGGRIGAQKSGGPGGSRRSGHSPVHNSLHHPAPAAAGAPASRLDLSLRVMRRS